MPRTFLYQCSDCGGVFRYMHMSADDLGPEVCEVCEAPFEGEPELPNPAMGGSAIGRSVAQVQAEMERTKYTPDGAVAEAGATDMRDNLRPGDVVRKPVQNIVTQVAADMGHSLWGGANASQYISQAKAGGPIANPALTAIQGGRGR